jgi:hypothetical protein
MFVDAITSLLGIIIFLFIFWKRLKEDYSGDIIFGSAVYILLGVLLFWTISFRFLPAWFLWFSFLGSAFGLTFAIFKFKLKFYETLEALVISMLPWIGFIFLADSVVSSSLVSFIAFLTTLVLIFISYYFDTHYREFTWYKSGKIGFSGLSILVLIFAIRLGIAILKVPVLSFVGWNYEAMISGILASLSLGMLFRLARLQK